MTTPRKGSSRRADIPPEILAQINLGTLETRTLAEGLAVDFSKLATAIAPELAASDFALIQESAERGITRRMELLGAILLRHFGLDELDRFAGHSSDTVRGWACYMIGLAPKLKLKDRLNRIRPLAADAHFGVREWAWIAVRPQLASNITHAIQLLTPWVTDSVPAVRRFAVEATRPRGVWASHIEALKENPQLGLPLLEPLLVEPERYVQDSVANWLNDAGKSQPQWVRELCQRWAKASSAAATDYIVKRATRNLGRK